MNTYAVGDVHGCFEGLRLVLDRIAHHSRGEAARVILLGNYVNIGPDSKKVLDLLIERPSITALRGNHDMMLLAAAGGAAGSVWNFEYHGGRETLRSFGVAKAAAIPERYTEFLRRGLHRFVEEGDRVFVHAAIDPAVPEMALQDDTMLLWARTPYTPEPGPGARFVVHGHFPQMDGLPEILPHRCNLDTAGVRTGIFTFGVFDDTQPDPVDIIQLR